MWVDHPPERNISQFCKLRTLKCKCGMYMKIRFNHQISIMKAKRLISVISLNPVSLSNTNTFVGISFIAPPKIKRFTATKFSSKRAPATKNKKFLGTQLN